jgi:branched-chain amino acid transport system substrate-binding protein
MKAMATDDPSFGKGIGRADGRVIHDMYLFEVKALDQSQGPWDCYSLRWTNPAAQAFRSLHQPNCALAYSPGFNSM